MGSPRVCVVHSSPAVRETLAIILGDGYAVSCLSPEAFRHDPSLADGCNALIIGEDFNAAGAGASLPSRTPVLCLSSGKAPLLAHTRCVTLSPSFEPQELRAALRTLMTDTPVERPLSIGPPAIDYPLVPRDAMRLAQHAGDTNLPVLLCGATGTGKVRLARAIHARGPGGRFVQLAVTSCTHANLAHTAGLAASDMTLYVSDLAAASPDAQHLLRDLLDCGGVQSGAGWHSVRLICGTAGTVEDLAQLPGLAKDLFYRLSVLPITLPRLRERTAEIPVLVAHLSSELARGLSRPPVSFTPRAMERLERYLWFGNVTELETVLTRTIALAPRDTIDQDDLLFGYGRLPLPDSASTRGATAAPLRDFASLDAMDLVINELAHEFKNPMAMIKSVSQHLERLLADADGREQVTRLTGEAVARMDRALDNLLQFTQFQVPVPERVGLNALLTACLTELTPLLTERGLLLNFQPADCPPVFVDAAQLIHAFDNLVRVIVRDLEEGEALTIRGEGTPPAAVFEFKSSHPSTAAKLSAMLGHSPSGDSPETSLGVVFARALVERNGGQLEALSRGRKTTIIVRLPGQETAGSSEGGTVRSNGKTASAHS